MSQIFFMNVISAYFCNEKKNTKNISVLHILVKMGLHWHSVSAMTSPTLNMSTLL